ncbi:MAG: hypothetical protein FJ011_11940 [Chloroflexi bacterium]|nr:hypothetical protein [Chloroflexota bacterium]
MSVQEAALYGDLVLALRDYAAEQLAAATGDHDLAAVGARLDDFIRAWFFTPQKELYGSAPRDVIWREQLGEQNPLPKEYAAEVYGDDCPICQAMREELENAEDDEAHGHFWGYCPDTCLLEQYDPVGAEERWRKEFARLDETQATQEPAGPAPEYTPPPPSGPRVTPDEFLSVLRRPWLDPELHRAAQQLAERCDVPQPRAAQRAPYRRMTRDEALSLIAGLHGQGVDAPALMKQLDAWPYQNVALDWLSDPEQSIGPICQALDETAPRDQDELARLRHHRDFILALARLIPPAARLWLSGWLEAVMYGALLAIPF